MPDTSTNSHFPLMILASLIVFLVVLYMIIGKKAFNINSKKIYLLAIICVVLGMMFGKYGANLGLPWWIYYPIPMLANVFLPPIVLKLNTKKIIYYLVFAFASAPFIHVMFSFFLGWNEYMPFWKIPYIGNL